MNNLSRRRFSALIAGLAATTTLGFTSFVDKAENDTKISVLLLTGQNNHSWRRTTPLVEDILKETDLFSIEISMTPPAGAESEVWDTWRPDFSRYDVILNNYFGDDWPPAVQQQFITYIEQGGTCLVLHAANNSFEGWQPFETMVGLLWRDSTYADRVYLDEAGATVRVPAGQGPGAGHGEVHDWMITIRDTEHPITKGMPRTWVHAHDELYHGQRGPAENMHLLATAYSTADNGGTGKNEPMVWYVPYGKGTVLTCLLGHLWPTQEEDTAFQCVGFRTLLPRCAEWLATGEVSIAVPENFPTADKVSVVAP